MRELWTAAQVAQFMGVNVASVYRLAKSGALRSVKVGRLYRFVPDMVDEDLRRLADTPATSADDAPPAPTDMGWARATRRGA